MPFPSWAIDVANHLWQSTLFAAGAWLLVVALRRNHARARYVVWLAASVKFLVPFVALASIGALLPWPSRSAMLAPPATVLSVADAVSVPFSASVSETITTPAGPPLVGMTGVLAGLVLLWLVGAVTIVARWWMAWRRMSRAARAVSAPVSDRERATVERVRDQTAACGTDVVLVDSNHEPGVLGVLNPVLFWPARVSERLTDDQIDAIVAHEMCHVRWHDNAVAVVHMVVEALFWFHPLVWWIGARLMDERERACDEDVLRLGREPQAYAEGILRICEFQLASSLACVSGVTGSDLRRRIESIMRGEVGEALQGSKKSLLVCALIASVAVPVAAGAWRSERWQPLAPPAQDGAPRAFDVVSVKANHSGSDLILMQAQPGGRIVATNVTLRLLIRNAYRVQDFQIVDAPAWMSTDRFDIEARANGNPSQAEMQLMLRALLVEHFKLRTHTDTRELPVYDLLLARSDRRLGPKLQRSEIDCSNAPGNSPASPPPGPAAPGSPQLQCGFRVGPGTITARGVEIRALAASLSNTVSRIVVDRTELNGGFDVDLTWNPADVPRAVNGAPTDLDQGSIFTSVQEQLGLKLQPARGPVDVLVIDGAATPADDAGGQARPIQPPVVDVVSTRQDTSASPSPMSPGKRAAFEVVSVKPANWDESRLNQRPIRPGGRYAGLVSLQGFLMTAYKPEGIERANQIVGYPSWGMAPGGYYEINATVGTDGPQDEEGLNASLPALMKSLLADRFKLVAHFEQKPQAFYGVTVLRPDGRLGSKVKPSTADCAARRDHPSPDLPACGIRFTPSGAVVVGMSPNVFATLVQVLSGRVMHAPLGLPVYNRTNLEGTFDAEIDLSAEEAAAAGSQPSAAGSFDAVAAVWRDQLGLKIERAVEPEQVLVIDHIERPTPD